MSPLGRNYCRWQPSDAFPFRKRTCLPINTINQLPYFFSNTRLHPNCMRAHVTNCLQPPRPTLQRYQDASIDCACHQMSHWCCATASHCNAPFPAPATQSHAPTLPGCFNHLPPNVTLVLRLPHNVTLQRTCNVPFPAATQSHAPTLPGCFNRLRLPPNVTLVLRLPHNVTMQRTIPCTSHTDPRCNWKCHVYKRANFTCTSEPISRVQANPRPFETRNDLANFDEPQGCTLTPTLEHNEHLNTKTGKRPSARRN